MNCYHKILQKNVYRACDGNCKQIASVTTFHRNDNFRGVMANEMTPSNNKLSSRTQCGHLVFCHYECSEVIQKQVLLAMGLRQSLRFFASDKKCRQVLSRVRKPARVTRTTCKNCGQEREFLECYREW